MKKFSEISIGDCAEVLHVITERDLQKFVELTGDDNRLHVDSEYAKQTSFKSRVVHGMLGASFISTVIGTKIPGDGALWFSQTLEFIAPVRVGDKIRVVATVIEKIPRDSILVLSTHIFNQDGQKVTGGVAKVKVVEPALPEAPALPGQARGPRAALIIGATGGVGSAVARIFAARKYDLLLTYRSDVEKAQKLQNELTAMGTRIMIAEADVCLESAILELRDRCQRFFGGIDYVINTATAPVPAIALDALKWESFERHFLVNIKSSLLLAQHMSPLMAGRKSPGFVFISSQTTESPMPGLLPYITAKSALSGFARSLAIELAPLGIRSNLVSPGMIDTDLIANVPRKTRLTIEAKCPRRRLATAKDVAAAVAYLASDDGDYVTGETLRVNGGQVMM